MTEMASVLPSRDPGEFHPREAREQFRQNKLTHISCSQFCAGYLQSNIACVPSNMADDFERLCISNSSPFPLLYRSQPGEVSVPPLASESDVRLVEVDRCDKAKKKKQKRGRFIMTPGLKPRRCWFKFRSDQQLSNTTQHFAFSSASFELFVS